MPAAFRRLCVETLAIRGAFLICSNQPPSGGCVLKPVAIYREAGLLPQPPSGGCVLKRLLE